MASTASAAAAAASPLTTASHDAPDDFLAEADEEFEEEIQYDDDEEMPPPEAPRSAAAASKHATDTAQQGLLSRLALAPHKAGMENVDKAKADQVILESSLGSRFAVNEERKERHVTERVQVMKRRAAALRPAQLLEVENQLKADIKLLEAQRDFSRIIVHVDADAFYASVEERERPELKSVPMAVGGISMLSTANYAARKFSIRSAMPGYIARKLCPQLVIIKPRFPVYIQASQEIRAILQRYDPDLMSMSLDEAYLDITEYVNKLSPAEIQALPGRPEQSVAERVVEQMRAAVSATTQLTVSAGIACNRLLAKIASDRNKPNGQYFVPNSRTHILEFLHDLPIRKLPGIGKVTERILVDLGVKVCHDLYERRALLKLLFSPISFEYFLRMSLGIASNDTHSREERKSVSTERTFSAMSDPGEMHIKCDALVDSLASDLHDHQVEGTTLTLKLKTVDFEVKQRSKTLPDYTSDAAVLKRAASALLDHELASCRAQKRALELRLMGVRLSNLRDTSAADRPGTITHFLKKSEATTASASAAAAPSSALPAVATSTTPLVPCPVCGQQLDPHDNSRLNQHVDLCLNKEVVSRATHEALRSSPGESAGSSAKKAKIEPGRKSGVSASASASKDAKQRVLSW